ncbi:calcium-binding protein [Streptomyces sp. NPDC053427]|uniref:calcium-binding protein n=1 Tax=Streptomyces sp. NPDC053427 TaxID=3365701 RepID=UPI0037D22B6C
MPSRLFGRRTLGAASALSLALGAGLSAPVLLAGTAGAATSSATAALSGGTVVYAAGLGQTNKVSVTASKAGADIAYLIDDVVTISAGNGCTYPSSTDRTKVSCKVATMDSQDPYATLEMSLGDGNDVVAYHNKTDQTYYFASIDLGAGRDTLTESGRVEGNDVSGGAGDDTLSVGAVTVVRGGEGTDTIHAADGTIAQGGDGNDTLYSTGDDSAVDGGAGNDVIHGGEARQSLSGGDGNDTLYGGPGKDFLYGGRGHDVLYGNGGEDTIYGNSGNDKLYGGPGADTLSGGPGTDVVHQD